MPYLEEVDYFVKAHGLRTKKSVDFSNASSVALPSNTTVNGSPIGTGGGGIDTVSIVVATQASGFSADYICNGSNDLTQINAAIAAASAQVNGGVVLLRAGTYTVTASITPKSNVTLCGEGSSTVLKATSNIYIIANDSNALSEFHLEYLTFLGNSTTSQAAGAIFLDGSINPNTIGAPVITNVSMFMCNVRNTTSLPIKLFGITGKTLVTHCEFTNCLDAGFIYDQEVIFMSNHSYGSHDNGFSISRGCTKITCVGNTVENPTFYGIWVAGFNGEAGPTEFVCTGNTVVNARYSGIALIGSPTKGSITGNFVDQNHNRITDSNCDGIQIYGDNSSQYANILTISGNTIVGAARAGITLYQAQNVLITGNLIIDPGTQFKADGTTAITSSDTTSNAGVLLTNIGSYTNVWVSNNAVYDTRATPYCNWDFWKVATAGVDYGINNSAGMRNSSQLPLVISKNSSQQSLYTFNGGFRYKRATVSDAAYSISSADYIVAYISLTTGRTATLPSASTVTGQYLTIKDETGTAGTNNITVATVSAQTIDGASTKVISTNYGSLTLYSSGSQWFVVN